MTTSTNDWDSSKHMPYYFFQNFTMGMRALFKPSNTSTWLHKLGFEITQLETLIIHHLEKKWWKHHFECEISTNNTIYMQPWRVYTRGSQETHCTSSTTLNRRNIVAHYNFLECMLIFIMWDTLIFKPR